MNSIFEEMGFLMAFNQLNFKNRKNDSNKNFAYLDGEYVKKEELRKGRTKHDH